MEMGRRSVKRAMRRPKKMRMDYLCLPLRGATAARAKAPNRWACKFSFLNEGIPDCLCRFVKRGMSQQLDRQFVVVFHHNGLFRRLRFAGRRWLPGLYYWSGRFR